MDHRRVGPRLPRQGEAHPHARAHGRSPRRIGRIIVALAVLCASFLTGSRGEQALATSTVLFSDGFESGTFGAWTVVKAGGDGTATVQSSVVKSGTKAARFYESTNAGSFAYIRKSLATAQTDLTASGDFLVSVEGVSGHSIPLVQLFDPSGGLLVRLYRPNHDYNQIWLFYNGAYYRTTGTLALNTWGHFALHVVTSGSGASTIQVSLNGSSIYQTGAASLNSAGAMTAQLGNAVASQASTLYADNIALSTASAPPPTTPTPTPVAATGTPPGTPTGTPTQTPSPAASATPTTPTPTTPDAPEFRGDAARSGNMGADTALGAANVSTMVRASGSAFANTGSAISTPAIYHGILYYTANQQVSQNGTTLYVSTMYAVNALTGQTLWSKPFPACASGVPQDYVMSSPAVTTGMVGGTSTTEVFIGWGPDAVSSTGCVYDFNGQTGALIWTYATGVKVLSSPAIMTSNQGRIVVVGDDNDFVHAFSVDYSGPLGGTGPHLWQYDTRNDPPPSGYAQYCLTTSEKCGDAIWGSVAEGIVTVNGAAHHYAFFGVGAQDNTVGRLDAIDMDNVVSGSPTLAWAFWDPHPAFNDDFGNALVLDDANGLAQRVFSGMNSGDMYSLDPATGQMIFDFSTTAHQPQTVGFIKSSAALATINGRTELIFGAGCDVSSETNCGGTGSYGYVWAVDALSTATGGALIWRTAQLAPNAVDSSPTVVNQGSNAVVFIALHGGTLLALNPATGATLFSSSTGMGTIMGSAVAYGGRVFVTGGYLSGRTIYTGGLVAYRCGACS